MDPVAAAMLYGQQAAPYKASQEPNLGDQLGSSEEFLQHFGLRLAQLLAPGTPIQAVQQAIRQTIAEATALSNSMVAPKAPPSQEQKQMELVYVHDCRNHGCNRLQCVLCKHNPNKRCTGNFAHKYWVGDKLLAKCEGEIQVELVDGVTGERITDDLSGMKLELCILDGNKFNSRCREVGEQRMEILDECEVLKNQKGEPLMVAGGVANSVESPQVTLKFQNNETFVSLKEVKVTESSESVLAGTKRPPFRMVVRAVSNSGSRLNIRPAVSEEFVVVTKRTKNLKKQEIPSLDDPISKLNHIGKETVKKLNEIKASADEMNLDLKLPRELWRVTKVREFQRVAKICEADGHMQQKLKQLLKLSKEKWDAACEHAKTAVQVDNRMRAWYIKNMSVGLLYQCSLGDLKLDAPVALLQNRRHEGVDFMEVVPMEHQLPAQRDQVQASCEQAMRLWWEDFHPGWMIFTLGNQHFETLNQIIQYSQSSVIKGALTPVQEEAYGRADAHSNGLASELTGFGRKGSGGSRREGLSFGGSPPPWPTQQAPPGRAGHHMSAQEESAALLSQMFAQQLAGNQEGRAGPKLPSKAIFEASKIPEGQGSEHTATGTGSRSIPPNPFEGLTSLPFQDSGKKDFHGVPEGSWNGPSPSWMEQLGGMGSVNSDIANQHNASALPSLLSWSNFAKNSSLGSFNSHNLNDMSAMPSVTGDELLSTSKHRGQHEGKGSLAQPSRNPSRGGVGTHQGVFGDGQDAASPSARGPQQGQDEIRQHLGDKLLKQLQQQQRTETQRAQLQQHHQQQQREIGRMQDIQKKAPTKKQEMVEDSSPALAHFNQLQRSRTPPPSVSPKHDSSKPWIRAAPNSPRADRDQPHGRSAPNSPRADRDQPWGRAAPNSPRAEPDQAWSRAPSSSPAPEPDQARGRPASAGHRDSNNVYNEGHGHQGRAAPTSPGRTQRHAMALEHMAKDNRERKRKRDSGSADATQRLRQKQSVDPALQEEDEHAQGTVHQRASPAPKGPFQGSYQHQYPNRDPRSPAHGDHHEIASHMHHSAPTEKAYPGALSAAQQQTQRGDDTDAKQHALPHDRKHQQLPTQRGYDADNVGHDPVSHDAVSHDPYLGKDSPHAYDENNTVDNKQRDWHNYDNGSDRAEDSEATDDDGDNDGTDSDGDQS